jgi:hypothetical protein
MTAEYSGQMRYLNKVQSEHKTTVQIKFKPLTTIP